MNQSINYSGFTDLYMDSSEDYEPYGFSEVNESLKRIYNSVETYKAGFNDREYVYDE